MYVCPMMELYKSITRFRGIPAINDPDYVYGMPFFGSTTLYYPLITLVLKRKRKESNDDRALDNQMKMSGLLASVFSFPAQHLT